MRSRRAAAARLRVSVLDRLLDPQPDRAQDDPRDLETSLAELRQLVQRDLEALLNARRPWRPLDPRRPELRLSPMGYGLSDMTAGALNHPGDRETLRSEIETLIRRFEPRLAQVHVTALPHGGPFATTLPLSIEALLLVDPEPEPVRFGTVVDPLSPSVTLQALRDG